MNLSKYQDFVESRAKGHAADLKYVAIALGGETGEALDVVKKMLRLVDGNKVKDWPDLIEWANTDGDRNKLDDLREKLMLELGDVLWYWVRMCQLFGMNPKDVMKANKVKLEARND